MYGISTYIWSNFLVNCRWMYQTWMLWDSFFQQDLQKTHSRLPLHRFFGMICKSPWARTMLSLGGTMSKAESRVTWSKAIPMVGRTCLWNLHKSHTWYTHLSLARVCETFLPAVIMIGNALHPRCHMSWRMQTIPLPLLTNTLQWRYLPVSIPSQSKDDSFPWQ